MLCLWKTVILAIHLDLIVWPHHDRDEEREVLNHRIGNIKEFSLRLEDAQSGMHIWTLLLYLLSAKPLAMSSSEGV